MLKDKHNSFDTTDEFSVVNDELNNHGFDLLYEALKNSDIRSILD
jgi:hypothetical protein